MADDNVIILRRHRPPMDFDVAMRQFREWAHGRGFAVASPTRVVGSARTGFGKSDEMQEGPFSDTLINRDLLFSNIRLSKDEASLLRDIAPALVECAQLDIKDCFAPDTIAEYEDERGRWHLVNERGHIVAVVIRTGEGSRKRYMLHLWDEKWYLLRGEPPYDIPMFGLPEILAARDKPVMIHEGPKAWNGAKLYAEGSVESLPYMRRFMSEYVHCGWHGADAAIRWTDWSPLRGRQILVWSDVDRPGTETARALAMRIARMGEPARYVDWSEMDIGEARGWDWADGPTSDLMLNMTPSQVKQRLRIIESPVDMAGRLLPSWVSRSRLNRVTGEVHQISTDYTGVPISGLHAKNLKPAILDSTIADFRGRAYRPGMPPGTLDDGRINICPPPLREPCDARWLPRDVYQKYVFGWLRKMAPNPIQRKHLIRRAAWALVCPGHIPQHMVIMRGGSNLGKSVFLDLLCRVAGVDRAGEAYPNQIFGSFNDSLKMRSIVCLHEIHSDDVTKRQNGARLKELIGNSKIAMMEKFRNTEVMDNVIHWFGATNEEIPFYLDGTNDRFYFVDCPFEGLPSIKAFLSRNYSRMFAEPFLDALYAAAKKLWEYPPAGPRRKVWEAKAQEMVGRVSPGRHQKTRKEIELGSLRAWQQVVMEALSEMHEKTPKGKLFGFFAVDIKDLVRREFKGQVGPATVENFLKSRGYCPLLIRGKNAYKTVDSKPHPLWCKKSDFRKGDSLGVIGFNIVRPWKGDPDYES